MSKDSQEQPEGMRVVVSGANRGLGLEFVRRFLGQGAQVCALVRKPKAASALKELQAKNKDRLHVIPCEMVKPKSITQACNAIAKRWPSLDLLVNNAGDMGDSGNRFGHLDYREISQLFQVNTLAPLQMTEQLLPLLTEGENSRVVNITSRMGSIADNSSGGSWSYRISKTALNMVCKNLAFSLRKHGVATMVLHPGWVRTDMGGPEASMPIADSVRDMCHVMDGLTLEESGCFKDFTGTKIPW